MPAVPDDARQAFRKALRTARKRAARKAGKLADEVEAAGEAESWLQAGEILKAHLPEIRKGSDRVELPDFYAPGQTRAIPLDPRRSPLENAEACFRKYRKLTDGLAWKEGQLAACREETARLEGLESRFETWSEEAEPDASLPEDLVESARSLRVRMDGVLPAAAAARESSPTERHARAFVSRDGLTLLVGKSARDNDVLSFDIGNGNDWWFHVAEATGSHVLVKGWVPPTGGAGGRRQRERKRQPPPPETLLDAAHLAVWFSKVRNASRADVTYAQVKNLRKAKHMPAGKVSVYDGKTFHLRIEKTRLDRLLNRMEPPR